MRLFTLLLILLAPFPLFAKEKPEVRIVCSDKANPPYIIGAGRNFVAQKPGITVELLRQVADSMDISIIFMRKPWTRALADIENNNIDGIFHTSFKSDRIALGHYPMVGDRPDTSRQLMVLSYYLYTLKDSPVEWDGTSIRNLDGPVATVFDYAIGEDLKKMGVELSETYSQKLNLLKLTHGRVRAVADLENIVDNLIASDSVAFKSVLKVEPPLRSKPYYLLFSKQFMKENPQLANKIWDTIRSIRESGEYDRIVQKYSQ